MPLRPEAEAKRDYNAAHVDDSYEYMSLWDRCITRGVPGGMFPAGYNNAYQIVQIPGYVVILYEMIHEARIIPLDGRPHLPSSVKLWNGDSRGHWEGNTLVVDTTNFTDKQMGNGGRKPVTEPGASAGAPFVPNGITFGNFHLIERFVPVGPNRIHYYATIEDPTTWAKPWTFAMNLTKVPDEQGPFEYACHEGNYGMHNMLTAARAEEAAIKAAAAKGVVDRG